MGIAQYDPAALGRPAWNAGRTVGVKKPLKQRQIWAIRFFLDREGRMRDRALIDLAIDSKLRGCDLVKIKIGALVSGQSIRTRAMSVIEELPAIALKGTRNKPGAWPQHPTVMTLHL